jgi:flagellar basal body-associated protein FliL
LTDIVTDWMNDSFDMKSRSQGLLNNMTSFESVALELNTRRRQLQDSDTSSENIGLYTASFTGVSLWNRKGLATPPTDPELVELIQRATFLEDNKLLSLLQDAQDYSGLGTTVVDVRAFITPANTNQAPADTSGLDSNLEIIIIIAIVVACLAFGLLMFAVVWAWKTDQTKREAYKLDHRNIGSLHRPTDGTGSESDDYEAQQQQQQNQKQQQHLPVPHLRPPSEIQPNSYPESVISEDISSSLTAYYRSSAMAGYTVNPKRELNDAASMSSMDSYGYSLDGYAPSLSGGPTQMGYPVGPLGAAPVNGQIKDPSEDGDGEGEYDEPTQQSPKGVHP